MIPKKIFQTWENNTPPFKMSQAMESWKQKNPSWEYKLVTAEDRVQYIKKNFGKKVLDAYHTLIPGAFKADLWRYCVLFIEGGVYVDADMICELPLDEWIDSDMIVVRDDPMANKWLANGFIAVNKGEPSLMETINRIVDITEKKEERFYLDYTGPALWGKCVNYVNVREEEEDYQLGHFFGMQILKHDFGTRKFTWMDIPVIHTEYNEYREEMKEIGNEPFFNYVQRGEIFREIPRTIIWTTYDNLDINNYMIESFTKQNPDWDVKYFSQKDVDDWFINSIYRDAYDKLGERGERTDFFRYCYLYENGGVYVDADTFCNQPLDSWVKGEDLIVGLEARVPISMGLGFENFNNRCGDYFISITNWAFATKKAHPVISKLINDIINNPKNGVLENTGPDRFTKVMLEYFGRDNDFSKDVIKDKSKLLSINRFGSNQSHSQAIRQTNPFSNEIKDIWITHMFDGSWRDNTKRDKINIIPSNKSNFISHNLTLLKTDNGFKGVARVDEDTERTHFMKKLGDCRTLNELIFDKELNLISQEVKGINNYQDIAKFEDFRHFAFQGQDYYSVSFIDEEWNTRVAILDKDYNFISKIDLDYTHRMRFGVGDEVEWEKNWLFFEKDNDLYLIYSTTPKYIVYKCVNTTLMEFEKVIDTEHHLWNNLPREQFYFSSNTSTGGSTAPIWLEEIQSWVYLIHTKIYDKKRYNHFAVFLDKDLNIQNISKKPFLSSHINYDYFFVSSMLDADNYVIISGGLSDFDNFTWKIPKSLLLKLKNT